MVQSLIDLDNRDFLQDPYPALSQMREAAPLIYDEQLGVWLVTRHRDVRSCLRDPRLGRVYDHAASATRIGATPKDPRWEAFWKTERHSLLELEPPEHTRLRRLVAKAFTVRTVEAMRHPARKAATTLLDVLWVQKDIDLIADFAQPYSLVIIAGMLGVPFEDHKDLLDWSHRIVKMYELNPTEEQAISATEAAAQFDSYIRGLIHFHHDEPRGGLVGNLVHAEVDGERLSTEEIVSTAILLLNAGHEAVVNTIGNGITAFLEHRDEWHRLVDGWVPAPIAIEEMIRWDSPNQIFQRWVLSDDFELCGTRLPFGSRVGLLFGSANRDPRAFEEPDEFQASRHAAHHVGFGGGAHHCLGAPLARIELAVALEQLTHDAPEMELRRMPVRHDTFTIHGYKSVPIRLHP
jgi:cytochrome P450